jgi:hypothetical protein
MTLTTELAKTCLNRGEEMDEIRLESYSKALAEAFPDDVDTLAVLDRMGKSRRAEFEPKIPSLGDLLGDVRDARGARLNQRVEFEALERIKAEEAHRRAHPEAYYHGSLVDLMAEAQQRIEAKRVTAGEMIRSTPRVATNIRLNEARCGRYVQDVLHGDGQDALAVGSVDLWESTEARLT